ncbi:hypothetical protein [Burkholderia cenocepacia]|uniref:hypothetical protein n=1 Tax=Burkholderia cenocepacia TaxID=95486 RepID=UPI001B9F0EA7|nr:hypothetical protein [Burkholderia cenocepacia]MBR8137202.1 hypothetical protein [Burkholderia cenocepacia]
MSKDDGQDEYEYQRDMAICRDAAIFVLPPRNFSRPEAVRKAKEIDLAQRSAMGDVTGAKATLAEAQSPVPAPGTEHQIEAIAAELYEEYFG